MPCIESDRKSNSVNSADLVTIALGRPVRDRKHWGRDTRASSSRSLPPLGPGRTYHCTPTYRLDTNPAIPGSGSEQAWGLLRIAIGLLNGIAGPSRLFRLDTRVSIS